MHAASRDFVGRIADWPGLTIVLALTIVCTACGGGSASLKPIDAPVAEGSFPLTAPAELVLKIQLRGAAYVEADLHKDGAEFDAGMPSNLVTPAATALEFSPDFNPVVSHTDAAFAGYAFSVSGYDRNPQVKYTWNTPPAAGLLYIALADWDADTWQWFQPDPATALNLAAIDPYIRGDGALLAVVLLTGTETAELASLRIGSQPPVISTEPTTNLTGFVPVSGTIDASASYDPDGEVVKFEWDLDGDGSFETDSGLKAVQEIEVTEPQGYEVQLRVTDNDAVSISRKFAVRGFSEWQHSWGGGAFDGAEGVVFNGLDAIYLTGDTSSFGAGARDVFLLKYNLAGDLVWARTWGTGAEEYSGDIDLDADGNICLLCRSHEDGAVLIKLDPQGEVLWARQYLILGSHFWPTAVDARGTDLYFCGYEAGTGSSSAVVAKVNGDGIPAWIKRWDTGDVYLLDVKAYRPNLFTTNVMAAGDLDGDGFLIRLNNSGDLLSAEKWGGSEEERFRGIYAFGMFNSQYWLTGVEWREDGDQALLVEYAGNSIGKACGSGSSENQAGYGVLLADNGKLWLAGSSGSSDGLLLGFSESGALESGVHLTRSPYGFGFTAGLDCVGDALIAGGWCILTEGASWEVSSGEVQNRTRDWVSASGSLINVVWQVSDIVGATGTPTTAVLDSGGGEYDCLVTVHQMP